MNSWKKLLKKYWVTVWMISAISLLVILTVSASYFGNMTAKRVVSTHSISDVIFSSNVMVAPVGVKSLYSDQTTEDFTYPVTVCNFAQMTPTIHAKERIDYSLTATLMKYDEQGNRSAVDSTPSNEEGNMTFSIQKIGDNNKACTEDTYSLSEGIFTHTYQNQSLEQGISCTDTYLLTFDKSLFASEKVQYCIYLLAEPTNATAVSGTIAPIGCYVEVSKGVVYDTGWSGQLAETDAIDYDAYNLIVSGSGAGSIEIHFDSKKFSISGIFLNDSRNAFLGADNKLVSGSAAILDGEEEGMKKVILQVDSYEQNYYEVQFFKVDSAVYQSAETVAQYVFCKNYVKGNSASAESE